MDMWSKAFGVEHVMTRKSVVTKLRKPLTRLKQWRISAEADILPSDILKKGCNPDLFPDDEKHFYYA